jgi:metal-sulfur cluster biosynthetic enzyme
MTLPTDDAVWDALRTVNDPEVGMNVVDLGLVYRVAVDGADVRVELTMTSPACPLGDVIVENARGAIRTRRAAARGRGRGVSGAMGAPTVGATLPEAGTRP